MSRTRIIFDEVSVTGRRVGYVDGRRKRESKKFSQTLNPFNIDKETGNLKTREQINSRP